MDIFSEERIYKHCDDDEIQEFLDAFKEAAESGDLSDWAREQLEHEGVYLLNPAKYRLAYMVYQQIKRILSDCCANYRVKIRKDQFINNILIEVQTDQFHTTNDTLEAYQYISSNVDGFECYVGNSLFEPEPGTAGIDSIVLVFEINDAFVELGSDGDGEEFIDYDESL